MELTVPTRLRVDLAGYHHVINRGVNRSVVFDHYDDKEMFLQIINKSATIHQEENISTFMRIVNASYAKYYSFKVFDIKSS